MLILQWKVTENVFDVRFDLKKIKGQHDSPVISAGTVQQLLGWCHPSGFSPVLWFSPQCKNMQVISQL